MKTVGSVDSRIASVDREVLDVFKAVPELGTFESPFAATGKSGVRHAFTLGAEKEGGTTLACDVIVGSVPADETKVLSLFIKVYDIEAKNAVICAVPSISEGARRLASQYKIMVLEAPDVERIPKTLAGLTAKLRTKS